MGPLPEGKGRRGVKADLPSQLKRAADPIPTTIRDIFEAHGIDAEKVRRRCPAVLLYDVVRLHTMLQFLIANLLNPAKIINKQPQILQLNPGTLASNLVFLQTLPMNAKHALELCPELLYLPPQTIRTKMNTLAQLGFAPEVVLKRFPVIVTLGDEGLRRRIAFLENLGLDARRIVKTGSCIFGLSENNIHVKFNYLRDVGLNAVKILNAHPQVTGLNIDRTLRPIIEFLTKDMGRSLEEINRYPACLSCNLEKRIKPRHRYMMAHGRRKDYCLSTLLKSNNDRFAWTVARQPPDHYHEWLKSF
jgi:hypothetical protein